MISPYPFTAFMSIAPPLFLKIYGEQRSLLTTARQNSKISTNKSAKIDHAAVDEVALTGIALHVMGSIRSLN